MGIDRVGEVQEEEKCCVYKKHYLKAWKIVNMGQGKVEECVCFFSRGYFNSYAICVSQVILAWEEQKSRNKQFSGSTFFTMHQALHMCVSADLLLFLP